MEVEDEVLKENVPSKSKPGIIYLSTVPPYMKPNKLRNMMSQFGDVGRIFLQPEDPLVRKRRKKTGGNGILYSVS